MFFAMRTNARMNRFEHRKDLSNARNLCAPTYVYTYVCTYLCIRPFIVWPPLARMGVNMSYLLRFALRSSRCLSARSLFCMTRITELKAMSL